MINLMYAGNDGVFDGLLISAVSATRVTFDALYVFILTMDLTDVDPRFRPITEEHRSFIEEIYRKRNPESRVTLIDCRDLYLSVMRYSPNAGTSYTPYTFLRLFADRIDEIPDKILYLDTDTLICRDLSLLYNADISWCELAAALDYYGKVFMGYHYFNAGVLLLNMKMIRKTGLFNRAACMCAEKKIFLPDQTALNRLVKKKMILRSRFNEQKHFRDNTVIQHFTKTIIWLPYFHTRNIKPWHTEQTKNTLTHKFDAVLDEYLKIKRKWNERNRAVI